MFASVVLTRTPCSLAWTASWKHTPATVSKCRICQWMSMTRIWNAVRMQTSGTLERQSKTTRWNMYWYQLFLCKCRACPRTSCIVACTAARTRVLLGSLRVPSAHAIGNSLQTLRLSVGFTSDFCTNIIFHKSRKKLSERCLAVTGFWCTTWIDGIDVSFAAHRSVKSVVALRSFQQLKQGSVQLKHDVVRPNFGTSVSMVVWLITTITRLGRRCRTMTWQCDWCCWSSWWWSWRRGDEVKMRRKWRCGWIWERNEGMGIRIGMRTKIMKQQRRITTMMWQKNGNHAAKKKCSTCLELLQIRTIRTPTALWLMFHPSKATTPFLIKITDLVPKKGGNTERRLLTLCFVVGCFYQKSFSTCTGRLCPISWQDCRRRGTELNIAPMLRRLPKPPGGKRWKNSNQSDNTSTLHLVMCHDSAKIMVSNDLHANRLAAKVPSSFVRTFSNKLKRFFVFACCKQWSRARIFWMWISICL